MGSERSLELWLLLLLLAIATAATTSLPIALPDCADKCGNVSIPYPFGIGPRCSRPGFEITCNYSYNPPKPFIEGGNLDIIDISLNSAQVGIYMYIAYNCFNQSNIAEDTSKPSIILDAIGPYRFSDTRNKFTALGCDTLAYIVGEGASDQFATGCASFCSGPESGTNASCTGIGCCQTSIPKNLNYYNVSWGYKKNRQWESVPCSYAMLADTEWYNFSTSDLSGYKDFVDKNENGVPLVLDWAVRNLTCQKAESSPNYACRSNSSECYNSPNGPGYLCNCSKGYEGNPYLDKGCIDIDECAHPERYPCNGTCTNIQGGYTCTCPKGTQGNATIGSCTKTDKFPLVAKIVIGLTPVIGSLIKLIIWIQKMRYLREIEACVKRNRVRVFTKETLKKAITPTTNFKDKKILFYKGELETVEYPREVAIKKSKAVGRNQKEKFLNEIIIVSKIKHRSVVRLLGCCVKVPVPMLVYEFIPNGTLFDLLHVKKETIDLHVCLEIAFDSADALAYLHSFPADPPIIHGAVKSSNILLGTNYKAKVSDLGASSLPLGKNLAELLKGGYLDPECISTRQPTDKGDVYSFGVVLLELITRKQANCPDKASNGKKNLASSFVSAMNQNTVHEILDDEIVEAGTMDLLHEVAQLALRCVSLKGEDRPTMKEVAEGLKILTKLKYHPWDNNKSEEAESLLGDHEISSYATSSSTDTTAIQRRKV